MRTHRVEPVTDLSFEAQCDSAGTPMRFVADSLPQWEEQLPNSCPEVGMETAPTSLDVDIFNRAHRSLGSPRQFMGLLGSQNPHAAGSLDS